MTAASTDVTDTQRTVVLTPHPLQRIGAFALARLVRVPHPDQLTPKGFDEATRVMTEHLLGTAAVESSKEPGGFWLSASYLLWPNASGLNTTNRKKLLPQERRDRMREWRTLPDRARWPGVPCSLCGRPACGYYGKVDVPLGASTAYRNTTPPDHAGLALCFPCVSCLHALPYGCQLGGGRAAALHSWDEDFLQRFVNTQVGRTLQEATVGAGTTKPPYWREVTALRHLRRHPRRLTAGVQLIVFSNSNKEQVLDEHAMEQPLAEWLRSTAHNRQRDRGYQYLVRAHRTKDVPGSAMLARHAFRAPHQVLTRAVTFLRTVAAESSTVPGETSQLVPLCLSYAIEVLQVNDKDVGRIQQLAKHVAQALTPYRERGALKGYESAHRDPRRLQEWLRKRAVSWTLSRPDDRADPFVTSEQWRLLFDSDGRSRLHQDLLFIAVLEQLHQCGWRADDADARDDLDDPSDSDEENQ